MNIGNITSDNFNLDGNGKDIQIEVYEQLIEQLQQENKQLKEVIDNIAKCFSDGHFEDGCDCSIIEKYIDSYLEEVSE